MQKEDMKTAKHATIINAALDQRNEKSRMQQRFNSQSPVCQALLKETALRDNAVT